MLLRQREQARVNGVQGSSDIIRVADPAVHHGLVPRLPGMRVSRVLERGETVHDGPGGIKLVALAFDGRIGVLQPRVSASHLCEAL